MRSEGQGGLVGKNSPAKQETQEMRIQSLGQEDPLEMEMATHSNVFPWKILWTEEPDRPQFWGRKEWTRLSYLTAAEGEGGRRK